MNQKELLKKGLLVGVGVAAYAQEKTQQVVKELAKQGYLNKAEGKKIVRNICVEAENSGRRVASLLQKELNLILKAATSATQTKKKGKRR